MELSRYLQSPDILESVGSMQPDTLRESMTERTMQWYAGRVDERMRIESNLKRLDFAFSSAEVDELIYHVGLHYFEKLVPLCLGAVRFREFLDMRVEVSEAVSLFSDAREKGKAVLCAVPHFGAVELIAPSLAACGIALTAAMRFKTERLSQAAHAHAKAFAETGLFAPISFIEVGRPGTHAALDMAAVLRKKGVLLTVFDEKTEYSVPVRLFSVRVWGGAGIDKLLAFCGAHTAVFAAFMVRLAGGKYRLDLEPVPGEGRDAIQGMYSCMERKARLHREQWYFMHEDIPFIDEGGEAGVTKP